jgi:hypothetical protein
VGTHEFLRYSQPGGILRDTKGASRVIFNADSDENQ